jgi:hypothetical protein
MIVTVVPGGLDLFFEEISANAVPGVQPDPAKLVPIFERGWRLRLTSISIGVKNTRPARSPGGRIAPYWRCEMRAQQDAA